MGGSGDFVTAASASLEGDHPIFLCGPENPGTEPDPALGLTGSTSGTVDLPPARPPAQSRR